MTMDPISPRDREAARLLRDMAVSPRQSVIWPSYYGAWSGNTMDAFQRGASALDAIGNRYGALDLERLAYDVGEAVSVVLETSDWPWDGGLAMLAASDALDPEQTPG